MIPAEVVAREKRLALPAALAAFAAVLAFIVAIAASQGTTPSGSDSDAEFLANYDENQGSLLLAAIFQALGMVLVAPPLAYLFRAAADRSDKVRSALIGITVAGPLFIAIGAILQWVAFDHAATDFLAANIPQDTDQNAFAEDLIQDQSTFSAAQGFTFAGTLGLIAALVYTSLHAMRAGLLTRFWGTLGMALGVSLLFLGPIGVLVFMIALGLIFLDRWPGGRPPAWDAGTAIPWPKPGDPPPDEPPESQPDPDEPNPIIDGTGTPAPSPDSPDSPALPPPRKRKQRDPE
jgi:MFS family permease